MTAARQGYLPQLDGIRAIAVLTIVVFHARADLLPGGYIGVDLFFVLSGYLITGNLLHELDQTGDLTLDRFYARRALRLLPAVVVLCVVVVIACLTVPGLQDKHQALVGTVGTLTYTSSFLAASGVDLGWMVHTWSLSVEEIFYLAWPAALLLITVSVRRIRVLAIVTALSVGYYLAVSLGTHWSIGRIAYAPDTRAEQLLIGALLAAATMRRELRVPLMVTGVAALALPTFALLPASLSSTIYRDGGGFLIALIAAVLIAGLVRPGPLARIASLPPMVWIGKRSYGIYLWNLPIVAIVAATPVPGPAQMPVKLALTFLIPALSFRYVEQPFLRRKHRYEVTPERAAA